MPALRDNWRCAATRRGLRLVEGVAARRFEDVAGAPLADRMAAKKLAPMMDAGLIDMDAAGLRITPRGRALTNAITGEIANALNWQGEG